jgi:hypothetical protein
MAQSSTTISGQRSHKVNITGTDISFRNTDSTIRTTSTSLSNLAQYDLITITGTTNNNTTFTVKSVASDGLSITVEETVTTESSGASVTIDYVGFVTAKEKGDGYYSQTDGVHTVAYHVNSTCTGSAKMQGSLATTPTEDDWFDITGTTFTTDQSTTVSSSTFTGNFVWTRAKFTGMTAGAVTKILYNH